MKWVFVVWALMMSNVLAKPHVLFVVVDDLGWNDVGFHGSDIPTPFISQLASEGVILDQYYVQPLCSPSRTAFMTGRYPYHLGTAHLVITNGYNMSIPIGETTIAQLFQEAGYQTHMAGKWDCGMTQWADTPTYRGFDTFLGYYNADEDHYTRLAVSGEFNGTDLHFNKDPLSNTTGIYSSQLYTDRMIDIINSEGDVQPLFLYLAYQAIHVPLEVPSEYLVPCGNISDPNRNIICGMVQSVDQGLQNVVAALKENGMLNNTIIVFTTDNGGDTSSGGNNWPLRGCKGDLYEGGVRGSAFVWGGSMIQGGRTDENLMHITDWLPTLMEAVGGSAKTNKPLDGVSNWQSISRPNQPPARTEVLLQLDPVKLGPNATLQISSYRYKNWKLIHGRASSEYDFCPRGAWIPLPPQKPIMPAGPPPSDLIWLFDLGSDPTEQNNVASSNQDVVDIIHQQVLKYVNENIEQQPHLFDPDSDPANFDGFWTPWQ